MSDLRQAVQQALKALKDYERHTGFGSTATDALRAALEQDDKDRVWIEERKANWAFQRKMAQETQERDRLRREYEEARNAALSAEHGEQPEKSTECGEPVAIVSSVTEPGQYGVKVRWLGGFPQIAMKLYTRPPSQSSENLKSREWRGLKEWEINDGLDQLPTEDVCSWSFRKGVYFAEAALKERNA
jgi:hypothetical protein